MIQIFPSNTTHFIRFIPRFEPIGALVMQLYKEETQQFQDIPNTYTYKDGVVEVNFDLNVVDYDKFQIKIINQFGVIYRGKLFVTSQETQEFKATKDKYYYE